MRGSETSLRCAVVPLALAGRTTGGTTKDPVAVRGQPPNDVSDADNRNAPRVVSMDET